MATVAATLAIACTPAFAAVPASTTTGPKVDAVRLTAVTIAAVAALTGLFAVTLLIALVRRRRRLEAMKADTRRRRQIEDAWRTAGERASTPTSAELERDRLDLDDTHIPGHPGAEGEPRDDEPRDQNDPPPPERR